MIVRVLVRAQDSGLASTGGAMKRANLAWNLGVLITVGVGAAVLAQTPAAPARQEALPPSDTQAAAAVAASPRHGEYVDIAVPGRDAPLKTWVVYPERKENAPAVIVIHEIYGLTDWIRGVADQLARDGFIALAADLLSGKGAKGGGTEQFPTRDEVTAAIRALPRADVMKWLDAVRAYAVKVPASNGKTATVGFCFGGSVSFEYATAQPALDAAVVYYGSSPDATKLASIKGAVLGLYGGDDARVNATVPAAEAEMKRLGRTYEVHTYEGAGHGFLRQQDGREGANRRATESAWPTMLAFLRKHTT
jgi:carboxymethylenebutenolidase